MYRVYILQSTINGRFYVGHTVDMEQRLLSHDAGRVRSTKAFRPWEVVYAEKFANKNEAYKREMQIKSYKGGRAFRELLLKSIP